MNFNREYKFLESKQLKQGALYVLQQSGRSGYNYPMEEQSP